MFSSKIRRLRSATDKPTSIDRKEAELTAKLVGRLGDVEDKPPSGTLEENKQFSKWWISHRKVNNLNFVAFGRMGRLILVGKHIKILNGCKFSTKLPDKTLLMTGKELTDMLIDAILKLLLYQFPSFQGLHNTLVQ